MVAFIPLLVRIAGQVYKAANSEAGKKLVKEAIKKGGFGMKETSKKTKPLTREVIEKIKPGYGTRRRAAERAAREKKEAPRRKAIRKNQMKSELLKETLRDARLLPRFKKSTFDKKIPGTSISDVTLKKPIGSKRKGGVTKRK
jgi:hypothetical protein